MTTSSPAPARARERLASQLAHLPQEPGVYLMKDGQGKVIYVGKAINLRARVRSYFRDSGDERAFVGLLDELLFDLEVVVVGSEQEALLLENRLIKKFRPRFNVRLRDDKNFLSLRLDLGGPESGDPELAAVRRYPRLEVTRKVSKDGARYFGPYVSAAPLRETLRVVNRHFGLRTCSDRSFRGRRRPCLMFQMGRCLGPCTQEVPPGIYRQRLDDVVLLLSGQQEPLLTTLHARMTAASERLEFEAAARLRDQIRAVEHTVTTRVVAKGRLVDRDVVGFARQGNLLQIVVVPLRAQVLGQPSGHGFEDVLVADEEVLSSFLTQYYDRIADSELPDEVLTPLTPASCGALERWLRGRRRAAGAAYRRHLVRVGHRGEARRLIDMANRNAEVALADHQRTGQARHTALTGLQRLMGLARLPLRIECFDVSTLQGSQSVASRVLFVNAEPDRDGYRRYAIRHVEGQDDFAMLYEVLCRRLRRGVEDNDLPDLLLVDGGKGQLGVAMAAATDCNVTGLALAGIAKSRLQTDPGGSRSQEPRYSPERLFLPGIKDPLPLRPHTAERALVERIRDEAHRFAITFHRQRRRRATLRSALDDIPGIGPTLRRRLLRHFGSARGVHEATADELTAVKGISPRLAEAIIAARA